MADTGTVWAFDLGKGSIGEAVRLNDKFLHRATLLIPAKFAEKKKGLRLAPAPVQELRCIGQPALPTYAVCADSLNYWPPQVLICEKE